MIDWYFRHLTDTHLVHYDEPDRQKLRKKRLTVINTNPQCGLAKKVHVDDMVVFIENKTVNYENSAIFAQWLEIRAECPFLVVPKGILSACS